MANGAVFGDGIYASNAFDVSQWYSFLDYSKSVQLIVNILIPGRVHVISNNDDSNTDSSVLTNNDTYQIYYKVKSKD